MTSRPADPPPAPRSPRYPLILSTWSHGLPANRAAWPALASGGSALDAVERAAIYAEEDLSNRTVGIGGRPDASGRVSLDASIMLSPARRGGVGAVRRFAHVTSIARRVMERTPHVLLAGPDADAFAEEQGFSPVKLLTEESRADWESWRAARAKATPVANIEEKSAARARDEDHDTIGILAVDRAGVLAGACSTSGLAYKLPGRVGDSPIVGHGLYVDPVAGAAVATGHGELVMGVCGSFLAVESLRNGASAREAARTVIDRVAAAYELGPQDQVGIIVLEPSGHFAGASLRPGFQVAVRTLDRDELVPPDYVRWPC
jgi:isoaspartyl peptidase/L-asparaginase-like protein (Ntn-hydrolase superfamily)